MEAAGRRNTKGSASEERLGRGHEGGRRRYSTSQGYSGRSKALGIEAAGKDVPSILLLMRSLRQLGIIGGAGRHTSSSSTGDLQADVR